MPYTTYYIYRLETNTVVAVIECMSPLVDTDHGLLERTAEALGFSSNDYGWTSSPAFGTVDGLIDDHDAPVHQVA